MGRSSNKPSPERLSTSILAIGVRPDYGTNGLLGGSMFMRLFAVFGRAVDILDSRTSFHRHNLLLHVVAFHPQSRRLPVQQSTAKSGHDGSRLARKHGEVVVGIGDGQDFLAVGATGDFRSQE